MHIIIIIICKMENLKKSLYTHTSFYMCLIMLLPWAVWVCTDCLIELLLTLMLIMLHMLVQGNFHLIVTWILITLGYAPYSVSNVVVWARWSWFPLHLNFALKIAHDAFASFNGSVQHCTVVYFQFQIKTAYFFVYFLCQHCIWLKHFKKVGGDRRWSKMDVFG